MKTGDVKGIKILYEDGTEKVIHRGVCFSVYNKDDSVYVTCDGVAGSDEDVTAVLAIVSNIAKELGVDEELCSKVKQGGARGVIHMPDNEILKALELCRY